MNNATPLPTEQPQDVQKPRVNKVLGIIVAVLVIVLLVVIAVYVSGMFQKPVEPNPKPLPVLSPSVSPTPADEEEQVDSVDTGDVEQDLQDVQKDVDAL